MISEIQRVTERLCAILDTVGTRKLGSVASHAVGRVRVAFATATPAAMIDAVADLVDSLDKIGTRKLGHEGTRALSDVRLYLRRARKPSAPID